MWYMGVYVLGTSLAVSEDGVHWVKPDLPVVPGTNLVASDARDSSTIWLDLEEPDPARRYKMFRSHVVGPAGYGISTYRSADGIRWGERLGPGGPANDRTTVFWNPFRRVWVYSVRHRAEGFGRIRRYRETPDPVADSPWASVDERLFSFWVTGDPDGASHGYWAAGGPGFAGAVDREA